MLVNESEPRLSFVFMRMMLQVVVESITALCSIGLGDEFFFIRRHLLALTCAITYQKLALFSADCIFLNHVHYPKKGDSKVAGVNAHILCEERRH